MTIAAESFVGRVLAVFSRRSPGFRPPLKTSCLLSVPDSPATSPPAPFPDVPRPRETPQADPAQDGMAGLDLVDVTARWKSVSPQERLRRRGDLLRVADFLETAADTDLPWAFDQALNLAYDFAEDRDLNRELALNLAFDCDLAHDRLLVLDLATSLAHDIDLALSFDRDLNHDRALAFARVLARVLARALAFDLDHDHDFNQARALTLILNHPLASRYNLDIDRARAGELARALVRTHDRARVGARALALGVARALGIARVVAPELDRDFIEAHGNLTDAANNFVGADLTTTDPAEADFAGIHWDSDTQWPTSEWAARIQRASVEDPPGSGVFIVRPEERHVDHGSLAPIS